MRDNPHSSPAGVSQAGMGGCGAHALTGVVCHPYVCRRSALEKEMQREGMPEEQKRQVISELEKRESDYTRLQRQRMTADDFEPLNIIGRGAFGEVCAVQCAQIRRRAWGATAGDAMPA